MHSSIWFSRAGTAVQQLSMPCWERDRFLCSINRPPLKRSLTNEAEMQFVLERRLQKNNHLAGRIDRHSLTEMIEKLMINFIINGGGQDFRGRSGKPGWGGWCVRNVPVREHKGCTMSRVLVYTSWQKLSVTLSHCPNQADYKQGQFCNNLKKEKKEKKPALHNDKTLTTRNLTVSERRN